MSSEYGFSSTDILALSLREIDWRLSAIGTRNNADWKIQASLHGIDLKGDEKPAKVSEANKAAIEAEAKKRFKWR